MSKKPIDTAGRMAEIMAAKRSSELQGEAPPSPAPVEAPAAHPVRSMVKAPIEPKAASEEPTKHVGRGRPLGSTNAKPGKKSDEDYCPTTIYIRKDTRKRVKQALLDAESVEDVSDLVERLLGEWLNASP